MFKEFELRHFRKKRVRVLKGCIPGTVEELHDKYKTGFVACFVDFTVRLLDFVRHLTTFHHRSCGIIRDSFVIHWYE